MRCCPASLAGASRAALWAAGGWELAKYAFVWNLGRLDLMTTYGPLTFAVTLVLWAYLAAADGDGRELPTGV